MKNVFGIFGILFLLKQLEGMLQFYTLVSTDAAKINTWIAIQGCLCTAIICYLLYSIGKFAYKVIAFWYNPDPNAEIHL
jgi:hypothetical protein